MLSGSDGQTRDGPSSGGILIVAVLIVAATLSRWGAFSWEALTLVTAGTALAVALHVKPDLLRLPSEPILLALAIGSIVCIFPNAGRHERLVSYIREVWQGDKVFQERYSGPGIALRVLLAAAFLLSLAYLLRGREKWKRRLPYIFAALAAIAIATRILMPFSSPHPAIDVHVSQTIGAKGLLVKVGPPAERERMIEEIAEQPAEAWTLRRNLNVYAMEFPSPYFDERRQGPRLDAEGNPVKDAWFDHYGYPPLTIYANALSLLLFREVRGFWIVCDLFAALCIYLVARRMRPAPEDRRRAELATLAFLFMPRSLYVVEQSWTEPLVVATLGALALALACRRGAGVVGVLLGLCLSAKQYVVIGMVGLLRLLRPMRFAAIAVLVAGATGLIILAPMALWDFGAMWRDVFGFFMESAPRPDALSLVGALARWNVHAPWWTIAPLWLAGIVFFAWRMQRTLSGFLFCAASTWLFFFMLGKQAFMNYYYAIVFALFLAVAAAPRAARPTRE